MPNQLLDSIENTFNKCLQIAESKNADYSYGDNPYKNFEMSELIGVSTAKGILIRMMDKISRIGNLLDREAKVADEKITDTLDDLINYAAILKAYLEK